MTELLFDDSPLTVLPRVAKEIGLHEAMVLQQMHYWLNPTRNKHFKENRHWIYNSYAQWQEQFCFLAEITIRKTIKSLEKQGILVAKNFNKSSFDKTKWYTIDYAKLAEVACSKRLPKPNSASIHKATDRSDTNNNSIRLSVTDDVIQQIDCTQNNDRENTGLDRADIIDQSYDITYQCMRFKTSMEMIPNIASYMYTKTTTEITTENTLSSLSNHQLMKHEYSVKEPSLNLLTRDLPEINTAEGLKNGGRDETNRSLLVFGGGAIVSAVEFKQDAEVDCHPTVCIQESQQQDALPESSELTAEVEDGLRLPSKASTANPRSPVIESRQEVAESHHSPVGQKLRQHDVKLEALVERQPDNLASKKQSKLRAEALKELVAIWEKNIPPAGRSLTLTDARAKQLEKLFKTHLESSVDEWQKFVESITKSDFLMGKSSKFRASFDWALKEPNALKIMEGTYKNQDQKAEMEQKRPDPLEILEQDSNMDPTWKLLLQKSIKRFSKDDYFDWFSKMQMVSCEKQVLTIAVPTELHKNWITSRHGSYLNITAKDLFGIEHVCFEIREEICKV